jgi:class 3 adenylate cyclase/tetratricopeptide (TPR) repeat protein
VLCPECQQHNREGARFCDKCGGPLGASESHPVNAPTGPLTVGAGRYCVERLVGEGARKRVYAATDSRLGREVALAIVKTDGLDGAGRERIAREARAMARLGDHPHIVTVYDVGDEDDQPYIVSQLMPGGSVAELLERAPDHRVPVEEALRITRQVADALDHAHRHGVVHRDLKPANLWRAADGSVLLGDFGLAATTDQSRLTVEGLVVGTVAYLAPEQAVGRAPDARSDLYALGALLYELVTGRPPFLGDDAVTVISQHLSTPPVVPSWHNAAVPPALDALVLRLLAKDPADRPPSAAALIDELARIELTPPAEQPAAAAVAPATRLLTYGRLVGRADELRQLTDAYDEMVGGRTKLLMVVGEPGIGKSRLVEELAVYASVRGANVCWGHCYEGELGMPYLPFIEAFRTYVRERTDEQLRAELSSGAPEVATLVSELRLRFADLPASPPLDGDAERMRLFEGVCAFVRNAAADEPLVLLLDDLHWADKPSLLMLQYMVRRLRRDRVLIVGTYRDVELDRTHPLADAVASLRHEHLYDRVLLRGLSADEVKALIDAVDNADSPLPFAELIHRETEGNPFFVAEILRNLVETGAIAKVDGQWTGTAESVAENMTEGVREVIGRRLSRLSEDCNRMLTIGAAMPGGFSLDVVGGVLGVDDDAVLDLLDEALDAQVLRERREARGTYEFNHALIRQTLYGELSTPRRVRLHRQIAVALEEQGALEGHLGELAYHCFHGAPGGDVEKAVAYATRAGDRAVQQAAHEEAARFFGMALEALDLVAEPDQRRRAELLIALGEANSRAGESDAAASALDQAIDIGRRLGDAPVLGRAVLVATTGRWTGGVARPDLEGLLDEAVALVGASDDGLRARLLAARASSELLIDQALLATLATEAVAAGRRSGDAGALARALNVWSWTLVRVDQRDEVRATQEEIQQLAEQAGELELAHSSLQSLWIRAGQESDREALAATAAQLVRSAEQSRSPFFLANADIVQGTMAVLEGRYGDADDYLTELLRHARRIGDAVMVNNFGIVAFPCWRERGRLAEFETATVRAVEESPAVAGWRAGLAHLLCELGKLDEAAAHVDVLAADDYAAIPDDVARLYTLCGTAEAVCALNDTARAAQLVEMLRPYAGRGALLGIAAYHGVADRYLGLLEIVLGRLEDAVVDLETALALHERMGARPWAARTRYDLARALVARSRPGDRERAVGLLNQAIEAANAIEMPRLVEEALLVKLSLQGVASSSPGMSIDVIAAGLSVERPDLGAHAAPDGRVTIVFSDIAGYSATTERLGDERTQQLLREHNAIVRDEVRKHHGVEVKSQGDGFMLAFTDPEEAVDCATAIQRRVSDHDFGGEHIALRVGIHVGKVIREADDFFGRTVILAARVADRATAGEILATPEIVAAVPRAIFAEARALALKGLSGTHLAHVLDWHRSNS